MKSIDPNSLVAPKGFVYNDVSISSGILTPDQLDSLLDLGDHVHWSNSFPEDLVAHEASSGSAMAYLIDRRLVVKYSDPEAEDIRDGLGQRPAITPRFTPHVHVSNEWADEDDQGNTGQDLSGSPFEGVDNGAGASNKDDRTPETIALDDTIALDAPKFIPTTKAGQALQNVKDQAEHSVHDFENIFQAASRSVKDGQSMGMDLADPSRLFTDGKAFSKDAFKDNFEFRLISCLDVSASTFGSGYIHPILMMGHFLQLMCGALRRSGRQNVFSDTFIYATRVAHLTESMVHRFSELYAIDVDRHAGWTSAQEKFLRQIHPGNTPEEDLKQAFRSVGGSTSIISAAEEAFQVCSANPDQEGLILLITDGDIDGYGLANWMRATHIPGRMLPTFVSIGRDVPPAIQDVSTWTSLSIPHKAATDFNSFLGRLGTTLETIAQDILDRRSLNQ